MALRQSRAGIGSRFGAFNYSDRLDDLHDEDTGHDAMKSSWVPPDRKITRSYIVEDLEAPPVEVSSSVDSTAMFEHDRSGQSGSSDDGNSSTGQHNEAPDDIMFGVSLGDSVPPRSLIGMTHSDELHLEDSLEGKDLAQLEDAPAGLLIPASNSVSHDRGYATLFIICQASIFSTSLFVYLTTASPTTAMTDSIYRALTTYMSLIVRDIFIAFVVAIFWLITMKICIRPLLYAVIVIVPMATFSLSTYMISWSYKGPFGGFEAQARAMRWSGIFMLAFATMWTYTAYTRRYAMIKTVSIIKLSCGILEQNISLLSIGLGSLLAFTSYALVWLHQFERIFLRGSFSGLDQARRWIMQSNSWFLGAYFVWMFLWTLGVISGLQRTATSAAVSHWYFHRHDLPKPSQGDITKAALVSAATTSFGSICASSLLALMTRLPLIALPRRFSSFISLGAYFLLSAPILNLTNPLTLSYAAIHSIDISTAAKSIQQHPILNPANPWTGYRSAKMLLSAARATTALGLGTAAWTAAARATNGSATLYGYVIGLMAGAIGWAVVGSIEGMVSMITDASFVCYGIDLHNSREGRTHCLEAINAFGSGHNRADGALQA